MQDTFFDSAMKCVAMVTPYFGQKMGETQFVTDFHEIWHRCLRGDVYVQNRFLDYARMCVAMVTPYYGPKMGENLASQTSSSDFYKFP